MTFLLPLRGTLSYNAFIEQQLSRGIYVRRSGAEKVRRYRTQNT